MLHTGRKLHVLDVAMDLARKSTIKLLYAVLTLLLSLSYMYSVARNADKSYMMYSSNLTPDFRETGLLSLLRWVQRRHVVDESGSRSFGGPG